MHNADAECESNWLQGVQLISAYIVVAILFFRAKRPSSSPINSVGPLNNEQFRESGELRSETPLPFVSQPGRSHRRWGGDLPVYLRSPALIIAACTWFL